MFSDIHVGKLVSAAGAANTEEQQTRSEAKRRVDVLYMLNVQMLVG